MDDSEFDLVPEKNILSYINIIISFIAIAILGFIFFIRYIPRFSNSVTVSAINNEVSCKNTDTGKTVTGTSDEILKSNNGNGACYNTNGIEAFIKNNYVIIIIIFLIIDLIISYMIETTLPVFLKVIVYIIFSLTIVLSIIFGTIFLVILKLFKIPLF